MSNAKTSEGSGMNRARDQRSQATSARCSSLGQQHSQQRRPSVLTGERAARRTSDDRRSTQEQANSGMHRERAIGHSHTAATTAVTMEQRTNEDLINEMKSLKAEVHGLKRSISQMTEQQGELFRLVKSLKKSSEASHFDMGKCCHTENVNRLLAQFYCTNGRYPIATDDKKRTFMREVSEEEAKQLKDFWGAFYSWKNDTLPRNLGLEDWEKMREEDMHFYPED